MTKSQTFIIDWTKLSLIRAEYETNMGKHGFQEPDVVLHSFYVQLLLFNLILVLNGKFDRRLNFHLRLARTIYKSRIGPKLGKYIVFKS